MQCPHCGQVHPDATSFCPTTGKKLADSSYCINCGFKLQDNWKVCPKCGKAVGLAGDNNSPKLSRPSSNIFPLVFASFLVVVLAVVAYFVFSGQTKSVIEKPTGADLSIESTQTANPPEAGDSATPDKFFSPVSARLLYSTVEQDDQELWLRDLSKSEPSLLARGPIVFGHRSKDTILYGVSQQQPGGRDVYLTDLNATNPILIASGVDTAFADISPDGSKIFVQKRTANRESLELIDLTTEQTKILAQEAESTQALFIDNGKSLGFSVTRNGRRSLYVTDVDLKQEPQKLAEGQNILLLSYYDTDHLSWVKYEQGQQSVHIFDPADGRSRELLQAPNIRWAILEDGSVSFTLDKADRTEQYFHLRGNKLQETNGQIIDISPNGKYFIYRKNWHKYIGTADGYELRELLMVEEQVDATYFTPDSQYVIYSSNSEDKTNLSFSSMPIGYGNSTVLMRYSPKNGSLLPNEEVKTFLYPAGIGLGYNDIHFGGVVISLTDPSIVLTYKTFFTGDLAGGYMIHETSINGDYSTSIGGGTGTLIDRPRFTPDENAFFTITKRRDGSIILELTSVDGGGNSFSSESLFPGAKNISYQFTSDGKYAVIGVTTIKDEHKIYSLDLATYEIIYLTDGSNPQLLDQYSLDGIRTWR